MRANAGWLLLALASAPLGCGTGEITPAGGQQAQLDGGLGGDPDGGAPAGDGGAGDPADASAGMWEAELVYCIDETNRHRALADLPPLARSAALEAYAAEGAEIDHQTGEPHKHFLDTQGGGIAAAENEIPRWPISMFGSVHNVIRDGIDMMMDEGEGGPHHDTILGPYSALGCGIYRSGDLVTVVQDFGS
ncbi:MAG TPA: CAP domain-containing protein [Kofleriaceae bacterium]|nr:CAP domain-containing protein [Kofleriaceae bacterium]